jgi:hypothetical protein
VLVVTEGPEKELADWSGAQLLVAALALAGDHHHQSPEVEEIGAACADGASNPQIKPLKARYLNAVITNLLFAQP